MPKITSIINIRNKEVIAVKKTQEINCNCIYKPYYPLPSNAKLPK